MERSSRGNAFEITLVRGRANRRWTLRREPRAFAEAALLLYGLDGPHRRAVATRYLEEVIAPKAYSFCHRLARRLAPYR